MRTFLHLNHLSELTDEDIASAVQNPDDYLLLIDRLKQIVKIKDNAAHRLLSVFFAPVLLKMPWASGSFRIDLILHKQKPAVFITHMTPNGEEQQLRMFGLDIPYLYVFRACHEMERNPPEGFTILRETAPHHKRYCQRITCTPQGIKMPVSTRASTVVSMPSVYPQKDIPHVTGVPKKMTQIGIPIQHPPPIEVAPTPVLREPRLPPPTPTPEGFPLSSAPPPASTERLRSGGPLSQRIIKVEEVASTASDPRREPQTIPPIAAADKRHH